MATFLSCPFCFFCPFLFVVFSDLITPLECICFVGYPFNLLHVWICSLLCQGKRKKILFIKFIFITIALITLQFVFLFSSYQGLFLVEFIYDCFPVVVMALFAFSSIRSISIPFS